MMNKSSSNSQELEAAAGREVYMLIVFEFKKDISRAKAGGNHVHTHPHFTQSNSKNIFSTDFVDFSFPVTECFDRNR